MVKAGRRKAGEGEGDGVKRNPLLKNGKIRFGEITYKRGIREFKQENSQRKLASGGFNVRVISTSE